MSIEVDFKERTPIAKVRVPGPQGKAGPGTGDPGSPGKSAYEVAVDNGFVGTISQWLTSLIGAPGIDGVNGNNGRSAYQLALENGFVGTEQEWLISLIGADGSPGAAGLSAYEVAVANGFVGSINAWLLTLHGAQGDPGATGNTGATGSAGAPGAPGANGADGTGVAIKASVANAAALPPTGNTVGDARFTNDDGHLWVWDGDLAWHDRGLLRGAQGNTGATGAAGAAGAPGANGTDGDSAYERALANGFVGTEAQWLASLVGDPGAPGLTAYQLALTLGFVGTLSQWLASLIGPKGDAGNDGLSAYAVAQANGYVGTQGQWLASLQGSSAYQLAVANGFAGTVTEWLASLKGLSAYQIALSQGFIGNQTQWLASLQGTNGKSAYELAVLQGFSGTIDQWLLSLKGADGTINGPRITIDIAATSYALQAADLGYFLNFTANTKITVTLPKNLPRNWNCICGAENAQIVFIIEPGATRDSYSNYNTTKGPGAEAFLQVKRNGDAVSAVWAIFGGELTQAPGPVNTLAPSIEAVEYKVGVVANVDPGLWDTPPAFYIYNLYIDGIPDVRGSGGTFIPEGQDIGLTFYWGVIAIGDDGAMSQEAFTNISGEVNPDFIPEPADPPLPPIKPLLFGFPGVGLTVTSDYGQWLGITYGFTQEWFYYNNNTDTTTGGTSLNAAGSDFAATRVVCPNQVGKYLRCKVTATGPGGSSFSYSDPIGPITAAPAQRSFYLAPASIGLGDGSTASDALGINYINGSSNGLTTAINAMVAGGNTPNGRIYFTSGTYDFSGITSSSIFSVQAGGTDPTWPLIIEAAGAAIFFGSRTIVSLPTDEDAVTLIGLRWPGPSTWTAGQYLFQMGTGGSASTPNIHMRNFVNLSRFSVCFALRTTCSNVQFTNLRATNIGTLIDNIVTEGSTAPITKAYIRSCTVDGNSKTAFRFQYTSNQILVEDCHVHGHRLTGESQNGWQAGLTGKGTIKNIFWNGGDGDNMYYDAGFTDQRTLVGGQPNPDYKKRFFSNPDGVYTTEYWNADIIDIDTPTGGANLTVAHANFRRCTDAGVDAKINNALMYKVTCSFNKRNFKAWGSAGGDWNIVDCISDTPILYGGTGSAAHIDCANGVDMSICGLVVKGPGLICDFTDGNVSFFRIFAMDETLYTGSTRYHFSGSAQGHIYEVSDLNPVLGNTPDFNPPFDETQNIDEGLNYSYALESLDTDVKIELLDGTDKLKFTMDGNFLNQTRNLYLPPQNYEAPVHLNNQLNVRVRIRNKWRNQTIHPLNLQVNNVVETGAAGSVATSTEHGYRWHNADKFNYGNANNPSYAVQISGTEGKTIEKTITNGGYDLVRGSTPQFPPLNWKTYFEAVPEIIGDVDKFYVGLAGSSHSLLAALGSSIHGTGWCANGDLVHNGQVIGTPGPYAATNVLGFATDNGTYDLEAWNSFAPSYITGIMNLTYPGGHVHKDFDKKRLFLFKNGAVAGDPLGYDISDCEEALFAAASLYLDNDKITLRSHSSEWTQTPPSGHIGWGYVRKLVVTGAGALYFTRLGAGAKNGVDWANAFVIDQIGGKVIDISAPGNVTNPHLFVKADGDVKYPGASSYKIPGRGFSPTNRTTIVGVSEDLIPMEAIFLGTRRSWVRPEDLQKYTRKVDEWDLDGNSSGSGVFNVGIGGGNLNIRKIRAERCLQIVGLKAAMTDVTISECGAFNVRRGIVDCFDTSATGLLNDQWDWPGRQSDPNLPGYQPKSSIPIEEGRALARVRNVLVEKNWAVGFSKPSINLRNECSEWEVRYNFMNSGYQSDDGFATGPKCEDYAHDNFIHHNWSYNCMSDPDSNYVEGDSREYNANNYNLRDEYNVAKGSGDGGIDTKQRGGHVKHAISKECKRNFRFWCKGTIVDDVHSVTPLQPHIQSVPPYTRAHAPGMWFRGISTNIKNSWLQTRYSVMKISNVHWYGDHSSIIHIEGRYAEPRFDGPTCIDHNLGLTLQQRWDADPDPTHWANVENPGDSQFFINDFTTDDGVPPSVTTSPSTLTLVHGDLLAKDLTASEPLCTFEISAPGLRPQGVPDAAGYNPDYKWFDDYFQLTRPTGSSPKQLIVGGAAITVPGNTIPVQFDDVVPANNTKVCTYRCVDKFARPSADAIFTLTIIKNLIFDDGDADALNDAYLNIWTTAKKRQIQKIIQDLKTAGLWAKAKIIQDVRLRPFVNGDLNVANVFNWKNPATFAGTISSDGTTFPAWTELNGLVFDGITQRWKTGWNPFTGGFGSLNDLLHGVHIKSSAAETLPQAGAKQGTTETSVRSSNTGSTIGKTNSVTGVQINTGGSGFIIAGRTGSNVQYVHRNASTATNPTGYNAASTLLPNDEYEIGVCGDVFNGTTAAMFVAGNGFSEAEAIALNNILSY